MDRLLAGLLNMPSKTIPRCQMLEREKSHWLTSDYARDLISVIVPTYNRERLIEETLNSVWSQSYRPIELIVVDDGSEDQTQLVVSAWKNRLPRESNFSFQFHPRRHEGACAARNCGLSHARGQFIQFLDSDDLIGPEKLRLQVDMASVQPGALLFGPWKWLCMEENRLVLTDPKFSMNVENDWIAEWLEGHYVPSHSFLWPRQLIRTTGRWDATLAANQDGDYFVRAMLDGARLVFVPGAEVFYRRFPDSHASVSSKLSAESLDAHIKILSRLSDAFVARGSFSRYRGHLAASFYTLAKKYVLHVPDRAQWCYNQFCLLSPDGRIPGSLTNHLLTRICGLRRKELFTRWVRRRVVSAK